MQRPPLREVTRALLVGYFFNNILPMRAGEAARVISLHGAHEDAARGDASGRSSPSASSTSSRCC